MTIIACPNCADVLALAQAENERLTKVAAAWKALAQAERRDHGAARFGSNESRNSSFAAVQEARDNLRALGINPDAP